jgi:hypothetical protein
VLPLRRTVHRTENHFLFIGYSEIGIGRSVNSARGVNRPRSAADFKRIFQFPTTKLLGSQLALVG